ncbi:sensor domain-containing protein [Mycobacterium branderi]|uniref:Sensor domain-containing protein n=1 Tax=Mycobacterium branderi TaxID=43348 RepID=A0A7I7WCG9_9MYCO|nr:sensor domain-containing protein [Mycobacterium branderi]MCV7236377.1 sensor domain-containing protein [Mycobacterium branderi]ORA32557.1 hypothetical protein BST20_24435 [Mycobacterium branderi]BBZ15266.1 sensor domain-containing protein [Mycobacterium branderi]
MAIASMKGTPLSGEPRRSAGHKTTRGAAARGIALVTVGMSVLLAGCTVTAPGHPVAAPDIGHWQPPPIPTTRLDDLLLSGADVNAIGGETKLVLRKSTSQMMGDDDVITDVNCLDAYAPIEDAVYEGSNWNAVRGQLLNDAPADDTPAQHTLLQAVVGFRDADSAQQYFGQAKQRWSQCANRPLTVTRPDRDPVTWDFADVASTPTTLTMMQTEEDTGGWGCQRAMGSRNNVIIDAMWCGFDVTNQAAAVVTKIADEVSRA